jgi:hypothetical protein
VGCLVQIQLKDVGADDDHGLFKVISRFHDLFGPKLDIVSKGLVDGKMEVRVYVPWDENRASEKLERVKKDRNVHKAKIIC